MVYDTEFMICFAGSAGKTMKARAIEFLRTNPGPLYTSRVCWMEFAEGAETLIAVKRQLRDFTVIEIDEAIAWHASRIGRLLKGKGLHIGDNDVWIAATALAHGLPLISNNAKHLGRVPGLTLQGY